jgi:hypothetical protein
MSTRRVGTETRQPLLEAGQREAEPRENSLDLGVGDRRTEQSPDSAATQHQRHRFDPERHAMAIDDRAACAARHRSW